MYEACKREEARRAQQKYICTLYVTCPQESQKCSSCIVPRFYQKVFGSIEARNIRFSRFALPLFILVVPTRNHLLFIPFPRDFSPFFPSSCSRFPDSTEHDSFRLPILRSRTARPVTKLLLTLFARKKFYSCFGQRRTCNIPVSLRRRAIPN